MKDYVKPVVHVNEEAAEGVYAASGCYTASAYVTQAPEVGRDTYCVHVNATHAASDGHHSGQQVLTLYFNQPVNFVSCNDANAANTGGNGTNALQITYSYHNNANENIGLGDVYVTSGAGLSVQSSAKLACDYGVNDPNTDHTW